MVVEPKLSTLSETAKHFRSSDKTFKKHVIEYSIPHVLLGKRMLFDLKEVETFLKGLAEERALQRQAFFAQPLPRRKPKRAELSPESERYARMLGLIE